MQGTLLWIAKWHARGPLTEESKEHEENDDHRKISALVLLMLFALSGCGSPQEKADEAATGLTADEPTGLSEELTGQNTDDTPASPDTDEVPLSLDALQGHWVDVNGDTTLDFDGDQMTVHWGSYEDLYTVGVTGTDRYGTVFNAKDRSSPGGAVF